MAPTYATDGDDEQSEKPNPHWLFRARLADARRNGPEADR